MANIEEIVENLTINGKLSCFERYFSLFPLDRRTGLSIQFLSPQKTRDMDW